ncbi:hypothetical protein METBIDRAFT_10185 [Metschnikowia bicuspidata var. bicuspidata NRRL YB-4993]|uniref:Ras modification protein ERF4 n=1 Tax=Metschnikowia bicuspidata var. bicuspidata NRRL YB-4993 TaxID=869754 RepID=A0A1A0HJH4_9ASCO|nr:hypothetical protein METBIDRAFT_10185 [Metschnikowia bicuspidata var. bicuspidata NRRL YB-4993]OBA23988.1 hypothetical protein METBIDRAFT_10185 [Metschnikowia bicuspidata var. bicuspidata NRRL YB-4993]
MNDPLAKYAGANTAKHLVFFNYHEYLVSEYRPLNFAEGSPQQNLNSGEDQAHQEHRPALVVSHFPNVYAAYGGELYGRTRIVRVPRIYDLCEELYMVPQFSAYVPGHEPAALTSEAVTEFQVCGAYGGQKFGVTSLTPLVPQWLTKNEFRDIVQTINKLLHEAATPHGKHTWLENMVDFFSGALYSTFYSKYLVASNSELKMKALDAYVESVNISLRAKHPDLQVMSLLKSAMLSLDFQIPMVAGPSAGHLSPRSIHALGEQDKGE